MTDLLWLVPVAIGVTMMLGAGGQGHRPKQGSVSPPRPPRIDGPLPAKK